MEGDVLTIAGLVGLTLFISVGKWLSGFREWLMGFTVRANPLRLLGELLTCTISVGFVVGALWKLEQAAPWSAVIIMGGFISLVAYAADEGLALVDAGVRKVARGGGPPPMPISMMQPPPADEGEPPEDTIVVPSDRPLSEDEAHAMIGGKEEAAEAVKAARAAEKPPVHQGKLKTKEKKEK